MPILICGLGSIGRRHLRNLQTLGREVVLFRTGKSSLPDDELKGLPVERDLSKALERWEPEAAVISNPTALHLKVAIPAAEAGCHLLLEKPVSHTLEGIEALREALDKNGGRALVGFQFRFHPGLRKVKALLEAGAIGEPLSARAHWGEFLPDWHPWEDYRFSYSARADLGGGVTLTLCHPFDYLRWLLGEVTAVQAEVGTLGGLDVEVEDTTEAILEFAAGPLASVHLDYNQRPRRHWLEIVGSEGTVIWDNEDGVTRWWTVEREDWEQFTLPAEFQRNDLFLDEMAHFLQVVEEGQAPLCDLEDGVRAVEIALAAHRSSSQGCRIRLPWEGS